jgi:uncharacterized repeat protein (TIGR01451 family)
LSNLTYTVTVTNAGPSTASSLVVTDSLPASVTFVSAVPSATTNASNQVIWSSLGNLTSGASTTLTLIVTAPASGVLSNSVTAGSPTGDPTPTNNVGGPVITTINESADVSVLKTAPDPIGATNQFDYTIVVSNAGPSIASSLVVTDSLPSVVTFLSASAGGSTNASGQVLWTTLGNLAVGGTTSLTVSVRAPAGGVVTNTATALSVTSDPNLSNNSGQAISTVVATPVIRFYIDGTFDVVAKAKPVGDPLFVQATAVGCNLNPTAVETNTITLVSKLTGDVESFQAIESDVNSGKFQILPSVPTANSATATPGNGTMETLQNDTITATILGCGAESTSTVILIDPGGVVFDSLSNLPLAGATVTVVFATTELPAPVFSYDGVTPAPSTIITGPDGVFVFPVMAAGDYKFLIGPPPSYTFPTTLADGALPTNRVIVVGSRGEVFTLSDANPAVQIDIPLDTASIGTPLFIEKKADRKEAEIGDLVLYTITVRNNQTNSLAGVTLDDRLPAGFAYITNTTRTNGVAAANPTGAPGPRLTFDLGSMTAGELRTLTYRVRVVPGALQGDGKNKAQAHSTVPAGDSNIAVARVIVRAGVFSEKPFLIGKVFVDVNTNKIQDAGEPGVPGVRLYLNNGT